MASDRSSKENSWPKIRQTLRTIHLWMGIGSGIILFVVCLTGTIYTFSTEINESLNSKIFNAAPHPAGAKALSVEEMIAAIEKQKPGQKVTAISIPADQDKNWTISLQEQKQEKQAGGEKGKGDAPAGKGESKEVASPNTGTERSTTQPADKGEKAGTTAIAKGPAPAKGGEGGGRGRGENFLADPYTGKIAGNSKTGSSEFFLTIMKLHRWLLLDTETGRPIVGVATLIFCLLVISGLVIWIPRQARMWRQGLKIKVNAGWKRINHDLHNSLGFYAAIPLLIMGLTGLTWSFEWYNDGVRKMLGTYKPKGAPREAAVTITPMEGVNTLPYTQLLATAGNELNYTGNYRISLPQKPEDALSISKTKNGFFAPAAGDRITLNPWSGEVVSKDIFKNKPFGERVSSSIKALHVGNVYGGFTKWIYLITCLIATSLPITGTIIWINKLKKQNKRSSKGATLNIQQKRA